MNPIIMNSALKTVPLAALAAAFLIGSNAAGNTVGFDGPSELAPYSQSLTSGATLDWGAAFGKGTPAGGGVRFQANSTSTRRGVMHRPAGVANANLVPVWETSVLFNPKDFDDGSDQKGELHLGLSNGNSVPSSQKEFFVSGNPAFSLRIRFDHKPSDSNIRRVRTDLRNRTGSTQSFGGSQDGSLSETDFNGWLRATLTVARLGAGDSFAVSYMLESLGEDGLSTPVELRSEGPFAATNASFANASSLTQGLAFEVEKLGGSLGLALDDHRLSGAASAPDAPTALSATIIGETTFTANWELLTGAPAASYVVEMSATADDFAPGTFLAADGTPGQAEGVTIAPPASSLAFTNLSGDTAYRYRVRALNAVGASAPSGAVDVTTLDGNGPPTLDPIGQVPTRHPAAGSFTVPLTGITPGPEPLQTVTVTAVSDNPAVLPNPSVSYANPATTGTLTLSPTGTEGTATVTVTVDDGETVNNTVQRSFQVTVVQPPVNLGFDSAADLDLFAQQNVNASATFGTDLGGGGGGGLQIVNTSFDNDSGWLAWREQAYPTAGVSSLETSFAFNLREWAAISSGEIKGDLFLGFLLDPSVASASKPWEVFEKGSASRGISVRVKGEHKPGDKDRQLEIELFNKSSSSDASKSGKQTLNAMPFANWMRIRLVLVPQSATTFAATWFLEDLGPDGAAAPQPLASFGPTALTNAALASGPSAFATLAVKPDKKNTVKTYIDEHEADVGYGPPGAPTSLSATRVISSALTAHWAAPASGYPLSYRVELVEDGDDFLPGHFLTANGATGQSEGVFADATESSLRFTGLDPATTYRYRVRAANLSGAGTASNEIAATTLAPGENAPPTLDEIPSPWHFGPGAASFFLPLTGITDGGEGDQTLVVTAVSDNPSVLPNPSVIFSSPNPFGDLLLSPGSSNGTATVTVTVDDGASNHSSVQRQFLVRVAPFQPLVDLEAADSLDEFETVSTQATLAREPGAGAGAAHGIEIGKATAPGDAPSLAGWRRQSLSLLGEGVAETSILFRLAELDALPVGESGKAELRLGFTTGTETNPARPHEFLDRGTNANRAISALLSAEAGPAPGQRSLSLTLANKSATGNAVVVPVSGLDPAPLDNWMRLTLRLEADGFNAYAASLFLEDLGPDGDSAPGLVREIVHAATFTNAALASSASARAAFSLKLESPGTEAVQLDDHFAHVGSEADLFDLLSSAGPVGPAFDSGVASYGLVTTDRTLSLTVDPAEPGATVSARINGGSPVALAAGVPGPAFDLNAGPGNLVEIFVAGPGGLARRVYRIAVTGDFLPRLQFGPGGVADPGPDTLLDGEFATFEILLGSPRVLGLSGLAGLEVTLLDANGKVLATGVGAIPALALRGGFYTLQLANFGFSPVNYSLVADASLAAAPAPTLRALPPQLVSRNARPVRTQIEFGNGGNLPDAIRLRGPRGDRFFAIRYLSGGNVTAAVTSGNFATGQLIGPLRVRVTAQISPNRRSLTSRGRIRPRTLVMPFHARPVLVHTPVANARVTVRAR
jgi:hypothetical protein